MSNKEVDVERAAATLPLADLSDGVELIARSIARSGGRVVAVFVAGVDRARSDVGAALQAAADHDAEARVAPTEPKS